MPLNPTLASRLRSRVIAGIDHVATATPPSHLATNFRRLDGRAVSRLDEALKAHYFTDASATTKQGGLTGAQYLTSKVGRGDYLEHLSRRLERFRRTVVPWLDEAERLPGARILEIGCGTGSSTVALLEQGADVIAVDVDEEGLAVARTRSALYGLDVDLVVANAVEAGAICAERNVNIVVFFATLEHMTHTERMSAMASTWDALPKGGLWCVVEAPNRLWYFDGHTSQLPFFHWLPDDLAFEYSRFSPRATFRSASKDDGEESRLEFLRRGRGVSFHEFDLAMADARTLDVVSALPLYLRRKSVLRRVLWSLTRRRRYEAFLRSVGPRVHRGFFQPYIELLIRK